MCTKGGDVPGVIGNKSHHATEPDEKYRVLRAADIHIDTGHGSKALVEAAGVKIGASMFKKPFLSQNSRIDKMIR